MAALRTTFFCSIHLKSNGPRTPRGAVPGARSTGALRLFFCGELRPPWELEICNGAAALAAGRSPRPSLNVALFVFMFVLFFARPGGKILRPSSRPLGELEMGGCKARRCSRARGTAQETKKNRGLNEKNYGGSSGFSSVSLI